MQCIKSSVLLERAVHELCALLTYGVIVGSVSTYNMTTDAVDLVVCNYTEVSRPRISRPRPLGSGLETKTETWEK